MFFSSSSIKVFFPNALVLSLLETYNRLVGEQHNILWLTLHGYKQYTLLGNIRKSPPLLTGIKQSWKQEPGSTRCGRDQTLQDSRIGYSLNPITITSPVSCKDHVICGSNLCDVILPDNLSTLAARWGKTTSGCGPVG